MNILFIIDPLETLHLEKDTTFVIMAEATRRGHNVYTCHADELGIETTASSKSAYALARKTKIFGEPDYKWELEKTEKVELDTMQVIFMRKDPPFNQAYLTATYVLSFVDSKKSFVVNHPTALREYNEKLLALHFNKYAPQTLLTSQKKLIAEFVTEHKKAIIKPLYEFGGRGICILNNDDPNLYSIIELVTQSETQSVLIQQYLPEAREGDIRVVVLNGKIIGSGNRISKGLEHRNNLASGGIMEKISLSEAQLKMCEEVAEALPALGIYFAGLDVIGNYITEVNITSPTGVASINHIEGTHLETQILDFFEDYKKFLTK